MCDRSDLTCGSPRAKGTTNDAGTVALGIPNPPVLGGLGLDGYLLFESPTIRTQLAYWGFPLSEPQWTLGFTVLTPAVFQQYVQSLGQTDDGMHGSLAVNLFDCDYMPVPGMTVTTTPHDTTTTTFYGLTTGATSTDGTGRADIGPLSPGTVDVTAHSIMLNKDTGVARGIIIRAGAITVVNLAPTP